MLIEDAIDQPLITTSALERPRVKVIGLLGGIASGKSLVAREFVELGAGLLDADRAGHEVLRQPEVVQAVRDRWGPAVIDPDGRVDRKGLARIVFAGTPAARQELEFLEQLTHPRITELLRQQADRLVAAGVPALVLDAAVMLKAGWHELCDHIVFVDAPLETRIRRARKRGYTEEEFSQREAAQEPLAEKRRHAGFVLDNSGSLEATRDQVRRLWRQWVDPGD